MFSITWFSLLKLINSIADIMPWSINTTASHKLESLCLSLLYSSTECHYLNASTEVKLSSQYQVNHLSSMPVHISHQLMWTPFHASNGKSYTALYLCYFGSISSFLWCLTMLCCYIDPYSVIQEAFALSANLAFPHGQMEGQAFFVAKNW